MGNVSVQVPFRAAVGTMGQVSFRFDESALHAASTASLSIDLGTAQERGPMSATLDVEGMRQLVDGLMDAILAVERRQRLDG
ncbi:hypothetical protein D3C86_1898470 [compost metagenome]